MIDMKKKIRNSEIIENHPKLKLTMGNNKQHISEYTARILVGLMKLIIQLPNTRPIINSPIPPIPSIKAAVLFSKCGFNVGSVTKFTKKLKTPVCAAT